MIPFFPIAYLALLVGIGLWRRRPLHDECDFFLAGRSGGALMIAGSLTATILGAFGMMGVAGMAWQTGMTAGWYLWGGALGMIALGAGLWRRLNLGQVYSLPEAMGLAYGAPTRRVAAGLIVTAWISLIGAQMIAAGKILNFMITRSGWGGIGGDRIEPFIIAVGGIFIAYTCLGGQHSILKTDILQAAFILVALMTMAGKLTLDGAWAQPSALSGAAPFPFGGDWTWSRWGHVLLTFGAPFLVGPDIYSRLFSGRNPRVAGRAAWLGGMALIPMGALIAAIGVSARATLPAGPTDNDQLILETAEKLLSPAGAGLMIAALLAAVMSSADTCLLTVATLATRDLMGLRQQRPEDAPRVIGAARTVIVVAGMGGLILAVANPSIVTALWNAYTIYSPAFLIPFLAMAVRPGRRSASWVGPSAMILGGGCAAIGLWRQAPALQTLAFALPLLPLILEHGLERIRR